MTPGKIPMSAGITLQVVDETKKVLPHYLMQRTFLRVGGIHRPPTETILTVASVEPFFLMLRCKVLSKDDMQNSAEIPGAVF